MTLTNALPDAAASAPRTPILQAKNLVKTFGRVVGLDGVASNCTRAKFSRSSATTAQESRP